MAIRLRAGEDACPGVMRLTEAADGSLARIRLPGGLVDAAGLSALRDAAIDLGDGRLELTSRGNVQLRRLPAGAGAELGARLARAGLWPSASPSHERVRNIVASPLAGLDHGADLTATVRALDAAICASSRLAQLSGRFLFAIDDGRDDVAGLRPDVLVGPGHVEGFATSDPVPVAIAAAEAFLDECDAQGVTAWRVDDLPDGRARLRSRLAGRLGFEPTVCAAAADGTPAPPAVGAFRRSDGGSAAVLAVPLGRLETSPLRWLADLPAGDPIRITPWRTMVLPEAGPDTLAKARALGLGVHADSPWSRVSACTGRPGCAKALADVQADARRERDRWPDSVVHWSGCERRCGRPVGTEVDIVATATGYVVAAATGYTVATATGYTVATGHAVASSRVGR